MEEKVMDARDITSINIKPSRRKCSVSDYKCFDLYDQDMNEIPMKDCDVIDIEFDIVSKFIRVSLEVVDGKIHIWSKRKLIMEPIVNTFIIHVMEEWDNGK